MAAVEAMMDKAAIKKLLAVSKKEPVNCAMAIGADPGMGLLLLDKIKQPAALEKALQKDYPDAKNLRRGTALVDVDDDPKVVKFRINKPASGMARRLVKTLKGTGFSKVVIVLEDDSFVEGAGDEEEEAPHGAAAPAPEGGDVTRELTALVKQIGGVAEPARKGELAKLAGAVQAALKGGDMAGAGHGLTALKEALTHAGPSAAGRAGDTAPAAGAVAYGKARLAWLAARKRMVSDTDKLAAALEAEYGGRADGAQTMKNFHARIAPMLEALDERLADKLDEAVNAEAAKRATLVGEARALIASYQEFLAGEPLIADLDDNPFVPLQIGKTLTATLSALSATVR